MVRIPGKASLCSCPPTHNTPHCPALSYHPLCLTDLDELLGNCESFNQPDSLIVKDCQTIFEFLTDALDNIVEGDLSDEESLNEGEEDIHQEERRPRPSDANAAGPSKRQRIPAKSDNPIPQDLSTAAPMSKSFKALWAKPPAFDTTGNQKQIFNRVIELLQEYDEGGYFLEPVDPATEHYTEIIAEPMDYSTISNQIKNRKYDSLRAFARDVFLVFQNAMTFNQEGSDIYITAYDSSLMAANLFEYLRQKRPELDSDLQLPPLPNPPPGCFLSPAKSAKSEVREEVKGAESADGCIAVLPGRLSSVRYSAPSVRVRFRYGSDEDEQTMPNKRQRVIRTPSANSSRSTRSAARSGAGASPERSLHTAELAQSESEAGTAESSSDFEGPVKQRRSRRATASAAAAASPALRRSRRQSSTRMTRRHVKSEEVDSDVDEDDDDEIPSSEDEEDFSEADFGEEEEDRASAPRTRRSRR